MDIIDTSTTEQASRKSSRSTDATILYPSTSELSCAGNSVPGRRKGRTGLKIHTEEQEGEQGGGGGGGSKSPTVQLNFDSPGLRSPSKRGSCKGGSPNHTQHTQLSQITHISSLPDEKAFDEFDSGVMHGYEPVKGEEVS